MDEGHGLGVVDSESNARIDCSLAVREEKAVLPRESSGVLEATAAGVVDTLTPLAEPRVFLKPRASEGRASSFDGCFEGLAVAARAAFKEEVVAEAEVEEAAGRAGDAAAEDVPVNLE